MANNQIFAFTHRFDPIHTKLTILDKVWVVTLISLTTIHSTSFGQLNWIEQPIKKEINEIPST
jgi:hypothetical protein